MSRFSDHRGAGPGGGRQMTVESGTEHMYARRRRTIKQRIYKLYFMLINKRRPESTS